MNKGLCLLLLLLALGAGCIGEGISSVHGNADQPASQTTAPVTPPPTLVETTSLPTPLPAPLQVRGGPSLIRLSFPFNSSGREYVVSLAIDPAALPSGSEDCPLMSWRQGEEGALASYYTGIFKDPREDELYNSLLPELQRIQRMEGLNNDEYLELMVHFVQGIPYDPDAPVCPRIPAQVILDRKGDCDEKSILLLGLLYREGYDAAILLFPAMHHATAGIRIASDGRPSFRVYQLGARKYVYIETTRPSFIGLYPDEFENEDPVIIPTGNGTMTYRAINDVMHIVSTQKRMEEKMAWIRNTAPGTLDEIETLEKKLTTGEGYSTQQEYDSDYTRYSSLVTEYNRYVDEFGKIREVYLYILEHQWDRRGVSGRIANSKVENLL